jgi:hypothetical protein
VKPQKHDGQILITGKRKVLQSKSLLAALLVGKLILPSFTLIKKVGALIVFAKHAIKHSVKSDGMRGIGWIVGHHVTTSTV